MAMNGHDRPWLAYVGPFEFPWGRAASRRVYFIAKAIAALNSDVRILSAGAPRSEYRQYERIGDAGTIGWVDLDEFPHSSGLRRITDWAWRMGESSIRWLDEQPTLPSHVIVYGGGLSYTRQVLAWATKRDVSVILDLVEWYDNSAFRGRVANPQYWAESLSRHILHRKASGVIAISTLLATHYKERYGMPVAIVPPGADFAELSGGSRGRSRRDFIYAGIPGRKDDITAVIDGLEACARSGAAVRLTICGPTRAELKEILGRKSIPSFVVVLGPIAQKEVGTHVSRADFSVIIRPNRRSSHAGFPTKFVESLSVGTPVIANLTSDLSAYLRSGHNGIVALSTDPDSIAEAFRTAAAMTDADLDMMRRRAHATAARFHWRNATATIDSLLHQTRGGA